MNEEVHRFRDVETIKTCTSFSPNLIIGKRVEAPETTPTVPLHRHPVVLPKYADSMMSGAATAMRQDLHQARRYANRKKMWGSDDRRTCVELAYQTAVSTRYYRCDEFGCM